MAQESLKNKAVSGVLWTSIEKFVNIAIQFIPGIVLARLLSPEDYGSIGMLTIFISVSMVIMDGGFGTALIQKKRPTQVDYSTIFWWNLFLSVLLYVVLFGAAPYIADFYHMSILCPILRVQSICLIVSALNMVQGNQMTKRMVFKKISIVKISINIVSLSVTLIMAFMGYGVWSLVAQGLISAIGTWMAYSIMNRWRPDFVFDRNSFRELFSFGFFMALTKIINEVFNNIQGILIGRYFNAATMGYYSKGKSLERMSVNTITQSISAVTLPYYSEYQDDKTKLANAIKKLTSAVSYVIYPLMFILILVAKPLIVLLYSDKWLESVPFFQILCLAGLAICLQGINFSAISAIGKSKTQFHWTIIKRLIGLSLLLVGFFFWGIKGMLVGMVCSSWCVYLINAGLVSYYIGYKFRQQIGELMQVLILALISFAAAYMSTYYLDINMYIEGFIRCITYGICYCLISFAFKMESYCDFMEVASLYIKKIRKK